MTLNTTGMVPLGYGKSVRADQIIALVPVEEAERRGGRRTYVQLETVPEALVASRSERAILADTVSTPVEWEEVERALAEEDGELLTFEYRDVVERVEERGDLFAPVLSERQELPAVGG